MCVITICQIFTCGHLEAIFGVARCPKAMEKSIRYCNRECCPPSLIGSFSTEECTFCIEQPVRHSRRSDPDGPTTPLPPLIHTPSDLSTIDYNSYNFFRSSAPLERLFPTLGPRSIRYQDPGQLSRFIEPAWRDPIVLALGLMRIQKEELLSDWFGTELDDQRSQHHCRLFSHILEADPLDMEMLELLPCGWDESFGTECPGPHLDVLEGPDLYDGIDGSDNAERRRRSQSPAPVADQQQLGTTDAAAATITTTTNGALPTPRRSYSPPPPLPFDAAWDADPSATITAWVTHATFVRNANISSLARILVSLDYERQDRVLEWRELLMSLFELCGVDLDWVRENELVLGLWW